jgi:hypothetical protein
MEATGWKGGMLGVRVGVENRQQWAFGDTVPKYAVKKFKNGC